MRELCFCFALKFRNDVLRQYLPHSTPHWSNESMFQIAPWEYGVFAKRHEFAQVCRR
jgi:hypothetical protein